MNRTQHSTTRRIARPGTIARILAATFALGAMLAGTAQADMLHPPPTAGGLNIASNFVITSQSVVNGTNVTLTYRAFEAPYDVQMSTNAYSNYVHATYTSLKNPGELGKVTITNVPPGVGFFRLQMLGLTNSGGRWVNYTNFVGVSNVFVGAQRCGGCHLDKDTEWSQTVHAHAYRDLTNDLATNNISFLLPSCVGCHSVGYGQPGGFINIASTPTLADVGCEACHGPANSHVFVSGSQYRPVVTLAPELCGGCHTGSHHPTYDEYTNSAHIEVLPDVSYGVSSGTFTSATYVTNGTTWKGYIINTNGTFSPAAGIVNSTNSVAGITAGYGRQMSCGPCHSAATRAAMLSDYEGRQGGVTNVFVLPSPNDGVAWGPTCANCHDPHSADIVKQLRNPVRSTNYYTFFTGSVIRTNVLSTDSHASTSATTYINGGVDAVTFTTPNQTNVTTDITYANDVFAAQYDPNVQVCAQCHNSRGVRWDGKSKSWNAASNAMVLGSSQSFSRPPHHSPQYNMYSGILQDDYLNKTTNMTSPHFSVSSTSGNTNQCVTCHVPNYAVNANTNVTGHTFTLDVKGCALAGCHTAYTELGLLTKVDERQKTASNNLARVVALLNQWGATKAPDVLRTNYGTLAWEYGAPGVLGSPSQNPSLVGPTTSQQASIPDAIKKARFNLYMVQHDGSMGVHNVTYSDFLIRDAETNVTSQFPSANFMARTATAGYAPFAVSFTNLATGLGTYSWTFGDGIGTSVSANPTYTYTTPGTYSVTFTAGGTETMVRTNYIVIPNKPVVSFTNNLTVAVGTPITFTNTSSNIGDVGLWRWTPVVTNSATAIDTGYTPTFTYTYTNTGTFTVSLRATTPVGSNGRISSTNTITVTP